MCNAKNLRNVPKFVWIILSIIIAIAIVAITFGILHGSSYEDDEYGKETSTEKTKGKQDDLELDIHLRKHKVTLEHERKLAKEKKGIN